MLFEDASASNSGNFQACDKLFLKQIAIHRMNDLTGVIDASLSPCAFNPGDLADCEDFIVNRVKHYFLCLLDEGFEALHRPIRHTQFQNGVKQNESVAQ